MDALSLCLIRKRGRRIENPISSKKLSPTQHPKQTDIPEISHPFSDLPFPYIFPYTGHGIYGTLTERLGLFDLLNPYYNSVISVSWTYTDLPEPNKNGEVRESGGVQPFKIFPLRRTPNKPK